MSEDQKGCLKALGLMLVAPFISIAISAIQGIVLCQLWSYFIVTGFGAKPLPLGIAMGVTLIASVLTHQRTTENPDETFTVTVLAEMFGPLIAWLFGWIIWRFFV